MSPPSLATLLGGKAVAGLDAPPPADAATPTPAAPFMPPGATWRVRFADGAVLTVRMDPAAPPPAVPPPHAAVAGVRQRGTTLSVALAGGGALAFRLAEESGCVMLRDGAGHMVYAD